MRTKALLGLAALAVSAVTALAADNNVYSLNIVGYVNQTVAADTFYLLENPLSKANSGGNNITNIIPSLPSAFNGTAVYTFVNGEIVPAATFVAVGSNPGKWFSDYPPEVSDLPPGRGFYLNPTASGTITFVGEVVLSSTNILAGGGTFSMVGSPYPAEMSLKALGLTGQNGDVVYRFNSAATELYPITYVGIGATPGWVDDTQPNGGPKDGPNLKVGEGFFYYSENANFEWKQSFTVGP